MALLKQETGEYLKITGIHFDFTAKNHHIAYYIFANAEQRARYEQGMSEYEVFKTGQFNSTNLIETEITKDLNIAKAKDSVFNACYTALKADVFSEWVDV